MVGDAPGMLAWFAVDKFAGRWSRGMDQLAESLV